MVLVTRQRRVGVSGKKCHFRLPGPEDRVDRRTEVIGPQSTFQYANEVQKAWKRKKMTFKISTAYQNKFANRHPTWTLKSQIVVLHLLRPHTSGSSRLPSASALRSPAVCQSLPLLLRKSWRVCCTHSRCRISAPRALNAFFKNINFAHCMNRLTSTYPGLIVVSGENANVTGQGGYCVLVWCIEVCGLMVLSWGVFGTRHEFAPPPDLRVEGYPLLGFFFCLTDESEREEEGVEEVGGR